MFTYRPLSCANREIRLVRFSRAVGRTNEIADLAEDISLELQHASLNDNISYAALSYTWGTASDTTEVVLNGGHFRITDNLFAALQQLRWNGINSWLWIDAICIEQSNDREKSWQVLEMRDIYSRANFVYMWLGPGCTESDTAMDFILRLGPRAQECLASTLRNNNTTKQKIRFYLEMTKAHQEIDRSMHKETEVGLLYFDLLNEDALRTQSPLTTGIRNILQRHYWTRIWTIQEVVLPEEAVVLVGAKSVSLKTFDATFTAIWNCIRAGHMDIYPGWAYFGYDLGGTLWDIKSLDIRRRNSVRKQIQLVDILWELGAAPGRPHYAATDPRDIVYGLLGILAEEEKLGLCVDYSKTTVEVFTALTRALISRGDKGHISFGLDCCYSGTAVGELPTWVPDWQKIGLYGVQTYCINHEGAVDAVGGISQPTLELNDEVENGNVLYRFGCRVDVITEVMQPPEWIQETPYERSWIKDADKWFSSVIDFARLGFDPGPGEDYVWRTIMHHELDNSGRIRSWDRSSTKAPVLYRRIMRLEHIDAGSLTNEETDFIRNGPLRMDFSSQSEALSDQQVALFAKTWREILASGNRNRTLFKTKKGMFGLGYSTIKPGDIVTLIWGVHSPIVLEARADGGFYLRGDAYVDGIMQGEYLETNPAQEKFCIY